MLRRILAVLQFIRSRKIVRHSVDPGGLVHHARSERVFLVSFNSIGRVDADAHGQFKRAHAVAIIKASKCVTPRRRQNGPYFTDSLCDLNVITIATLAKITPRALPASPGANGLV